MNVPGSAVDGSDDAGPPAGTEPLVEVAAELYALPPGAFTSARNARAKQVRAGGDRALAGRVQSLRKPTLAAWAVDLLVRHRPAEVEALLSLGGEMLQAQAARAGGTMRELDRRQHAAMAELRRDARMLAADVGQSLGDGVDVPLESTLRAAMTDPAAAAAVRSGLLVSDLVSTGFGPVEVGDAVAVPDAPPLTGVAGEPATRPEGDIAEVAAPGPESADAPERPRGTAREREQDREAARERERQAARERERQAAQEALAAAEDRAAAAEEQVADARTTADDAARRRAAAESEMERLSAELAAAEAAARHAAVEERRARNAEDSAAKAAVTAGRRLQAARERLERLA